MIDAKRYTDATGTAPTEGDLERANCTRAGKLGHRHCGWCPRHDLPQTICATNLQTGECQSR